MESKCPVCQKGELFPGVSITDCMSKSCAFRCNLEDLPLIAAALELARAEAKVHKIYRGPLSEIEGNLNKAASAVDAAIRRACPRSLWR